MGNAKIFLGEWVNDLLLLAGNINFASPLLGGFNFVDDNFVSRNT
jgi:hypothetical protein